MTALTILCNQLQKTDSLQKFVLGSLRNLALLNMGLLVVLLSPGQADFNYAKSSLQGIISIVIDVILLVVASNNFTKK